MTQDINKQALPGAEATVLIDLSGQIRNTGFLIAALAGLIFMITTVYKPGVTDEDLFQTTYAPTFATALVHDHDPDLTAIFQANAKAFNTPYDSFAGDYLRATNPDAHAKALLNFLNSKKDVQRQYLLLFVENDALKTAFADYLVDSKSRWEQFSLPILDIKTSRNSVVFYLVISFGALHGYYCVKHRYLRQLRGRFETLKFLPDPSLLTATTEDLLVLDKFFKMLVRVLQEAVLLGLPLLVVVFSGVYCVRVGSSPADVPLPFAATMICLAEWLVFSLERLNHYSINQAKPRDLFGNKSIP